MCSSQKRPFFIKKSELFLQVFRTFALDNNLVCDTGKNGSQKQVNDTHKCADMKVFVCNGLWFALFFHSQKHFVVEEQIIQLVLIAEFMKREADCVPT